jgi:antitoxin VapB
MVAITFLARPEKTMSLNIKNQDAHKLAKLLAELTGETIASAVTEAIRERLERVRLEKNPSLAVRLAAIGRDCAKHLKPSDHNLDHGEFLYGPDGLPK